MNDMSHALSAPSTDDLQAFAWGSYALDSQWVREHVAPIMAAYEGQVEQIEMREGRGLPDGNWDLLFVGVETVGEDENALIELIQELAERRPLGQALVVTPSASMGRQLALMRAGATDVIPLNAKDQRIEESIERAMGQLRQRRRAVDQDKLKLVNQLAVSVNHEINNPLTGLMGTAELLLMENKDANEKMRRDLKQILTQGRRIQDVTSRLKSLNHLRTVPYGSHDSMIDLIGEIQPEPAPAPPPPDHQFLPSPKVLVVDDNPLIIDLVARLFEHHFHIEGATNAVDALARLEAETFDLLLVDLILPEMNGLELYRAVRQVAPGQKVLMTTAYQGDARVEQAILEGALGCVYKPFQLEDLEKAMNEAIHPA